MKRWAGTVRVPSISIFFYDDRVIDTPRLTVLIR